MRLDHLTSDSCFSVHTLPYVENLQARDLSTIDLIVIHCTELPDLATAREYGERVLYPSGTGNSGHFYIDVDGSTQCYVPPERIAHHVRGYNARAIGIELVNLGRWPNWLDSRHQTMTTPYTAPQLTALITLIHQLEREMPHLKWIAGHEDLDREQVAASNDPTHRVYRKQDPGALFPWEQVLSEISLPRFPLETGR